MAQVSKIEWTESTWNPVTGCTKVSPGCKHCYAERMANRLYGIGNPNYRKGFKVKTVQNLLELPLRWKKPRTIFVNSMSDLFHEDVPDFFILRLFQTMRLAPQHTFQILTKRSDRLKKLNHRLPWSHNIWMGVSVETSNYIDRIVELQQTTARVKFVSFEPLLGTAGRVNLSGIDWVIVGGESGPGARPMSPIWVREIRDICLTKDIPFFFKQWGGFSKKKAGRTLDGREWDQMPSLIG